MATTFKINNFKLFLASTLILIKQFRNKWKQIILLKTNSFKVTL